MSIQRRRVCIDKYLPPVKPRSTPPPRFDMAIEPLNLPMAFGDPRSVRTEPAPADSPLTTILEASPPKLAMFLMTHCTMSAIFHLDGIQSIYVKSGDLVGNTVVAGDVGARDGQEAQGSQALKRNSISNISEKQKWM